MTTMHNRPGVKLVLSVAVALGFAWSLMDGGRSLLAQTLATPGDMPVIYQETPDNDLMRGRARHKIKLNQCTIKYRDGQGGYYIKHGYQEFVILNQNPACLKRFAGKMLTVAGKTTESVVPWFDLYFIDIEAINGLRYNGAVGPWVRREPTDEEIRGWNLHKRLPPATQKFMAYLDVPQQAGWAAWNGPPAPGALTAEAGGVTSEHKSSMPEAGVDARLTDIQRQLTVIEQRLNRKPYDGISSKPPEAWNATDWSLYMGSQGG